MKAIEICKVSGSRSWSCSVQVLDLQALSLLSIPDKYFVYSFCSLDLKGNFLDYPAIPAIDFAPFLKYDSRLVC